MVDVKSTIRQCIRGNTRVPDRRLTRLQANGVVVCIVGCIAWLAVTAVNHVTVKVLEVFLNQWIMELVASGGDEGDQ